MSPHFVLVFYVLVEWWLHNLIKKRREIERALALTSLGVSLVSKLQMMTTWSPTPPSKPSMTTAYMVCERYSTIFLPDFSWRPPNRLLSWYPSRWNPLCLLSTPTPTSVALPGRFQLPSRRWNKKLLCSEPSVFSNQFFQPVPASTRKMLSRPLSFVPLKCVAAAR